MRIEGKTKTGFFFSVEKEAVDNMELIDDLADAEDGDPLAVSRICKRVLGNEQRKQLYDYLRTPEGRVPTEAVINAILDIFYAFGQEGKNGSPSPQ